MGQVDTTDWYTTPGMDYDDSAMAGWTISLLLPRRAGMRGIRCLRAGHREGARKDASQASADHCRGQLPATGVVDRPHGIGQRLRAQDPRVWRLAHSSRIPGVGA